MDIDETLARIKEDAARLNAAGDYATRYIEAVNHKLEGAVEYWGSANAGELGYAKVDGKWGLAYNRGVAQREEALLENASRDVRIRMLRYIEPFVAELAIHLEKVVEDLDIHV